MHARKWRYFHFRSIICYHPRSWQRWVYANGLIMWQNWCSSVTMTEQNVLTCALNKYRMSEFCGKTPVPAVDCSQVLKPSANHQCMETEYNFVSGDYTGNRCSRFRRYSNKLCDTRLSIRWPGRAWKSLKLNPELNRYRSTFSGCLDVSATTEKRTYTQNYCKRFCNLYYSL